MLIAVGVRKMRKDARPAVEPVQPSAIRADPDGSGVILEQGKHARGAEARRKGIVVRIVCEDTRRRIKNIQPSPIGAHQDPPLRGSAESVDPVVA